MDQRTVSRAVTSGKGSYLFGPRAFVRVAVPIASLPEAPPPEPKFGKPGGFEGYWSRKEKGFQILTSIHKIYSGKAPEADPEWVHFLEKDASIEDYSWWEGEERRIKLGKNGRAPKPASVKASDVEILPLAADKIAAYKAWLDWKEKYGFHRPIELPAFDAFVDAGRHARAIYTNTDKKGSKLVVTFAVKYFYPETRREFVRALSKALTLSEEVGFGARLIEKERS